LNSRSTSCGVKAIDSMNASTLVAMPCLAAAGISLSTISLT
jgi:hypothetical protein